MRNSKLSTFLVALVITLPASSCANIAITREEPLEYPMLASDLRNWPKKLDAYLNSATPAHVDLHNWGKDYTTVLSFVHVSDVQLRDSAIIYDRNLTSWVMDRFVEGTQRPLEIDSGGDDLFFAWLVAALNCTGIPSNKASCQKPDFLIHTGDAIEVSTTGEMLRFLSIANQLTIPWFNVIGNHDILTFGNFKQDSTRITNFVPGLSMITDRQVFMELHDRWEELPAKDLPVAYERHQYTAENKAGSPIPVSYAHGFDCTAPPACTNPTLQPYYSFTAATSPRIRIIVLDTTIKDSKIPRLPWSNWQVPGKGAGGFIEEEQARWLEQQLNSAWQKSESVLVFGHHPLSFSNETVWPKKRLKAASATSPGPEFVLDILKKYDNVLGYFGGHTHRQAIFTHPIRRRPRSGPMPTANCIAKDNEPAQEPCMLEVIAPSLHLHPHRALFVRVLKKEPDELFIDISPIQALDNGNFQNGILSDAYNTSKVEATKGKKVESWGYTKLPALIKVRPSLPPLPMARITAEPLQVCPGGKSVRDIIFEGKRPFFAQWSDQASEEEYRGPKEVSYYAPATLSLISVHDANRTKAEILGGSVEMKILPQPLIDQSGRCAGRIGLTGFGGRKFTWSTCPEDELCKPFSYSQKATAPLGIRTVYLKVDGCDQLKYDLKINQLPEFDPIVPPICSDDNLVRIYPRFAGNSESYTVKWSETPSSQKGEGLEQAYTFNRLPGDKPFILETVTDKQDCQFSIGKEFRVEVVQKPDIQLSVGNQYTAPKGQETTIYLHASVDTNYEWFINDESIGTGDALSHVYEEPAILKVVAHRGPCNTEKIVKINIDEQTE